MTGRERESASENETKCNYNNKHNNEWEQKKKQT